MRPEHTCIWRVHSTIQDPMCMCSLVQPLFTTIHDFHAYDTWYSVIACHGLFEPYRSIAL